MKLFRACDHRLQKQGCSANLGHCRPGESALIFPAYASERSGHSEWGTAPRARLPATQIRSRRSFLTSAPSAYQTEERRQSTLSANWQSSLPECQHSGALSRRRARFSVGEGVKVGEAGETSGLWRSSGSMECRGSARASPVFSVHSRRGGVLSYLFQPIMGARVS